MMTDDKIKIKQEKIIKMVCEFCDDCLNDEYKKLSIKLVEKLGRKHDVPFKRGKLEIWASSIIYALAQINFLFDKSFDPYLSADDICNYFKTKKSTVSSKAKLIRDLLNLDYFDNEFSTNHMKSNEPIFMMDEKTGLIINSFMGNQKLENLMNELMNNENDQLYSNFIDELVKSMVFVYSLSKPVNSHGTDDDNNIFIPIFTNLDELEAFFPMDEKPIRIPFFEFCKISYMLNDNVAYDSLRLNPENQNFTFTHEDLIKIYKSRQ